MKVIYNYYDGTTYLLFNDDEEWPEGDWTEVAPPPGIYEPYYFDGEKWIGTSKEEYEKNNPPDPYKPNDTEIDVANIIKKLYLTDKENNAPDFDTVKRYYDKNCYTKDDVAFYSKENCITQEQYKKITGEDYPEQPQA